MSLPDVKTDGMSVRLDTVPALDGLTDGFAITICMLTRYKNHNFIYLLNTQLVQDIIKHVYTQK